MRSSSAIRAFSCGADDIVTTTQDSPHRSFLDINPAVPAAEAIPSALTFIRRESKVAAAASRRVSEAIASPAAADSTRRASDMVTSPTLRLNTLTEPQDSSD
jgi:hypothetical protein